jgi:hypothetical protein
MIHCKVKLLGGQQQATFVVRSCSSLMHQVLSVDNYNNTYVMHT